VNLVRAAWLVWRSRKPGAVDTSMSRYGTSVTFEEQEFLGNIARAQACDVELKLLTRRLPILESNLRRAQAELAECQQKLERISQARNRLLGRGEQDQKLLTGGNSKCLTEKAVVAMDS